MDNPQGSIRIPIEPDLQFQRAFSTSFETLGMYMAHRKPIQTTIPFIWG